MVKISVKEEPTGIPLFSFFYGSVGVEEDILFTRNVFSDNTKHFIKVYIATSFEFVL